MTEKLQKRLNDYLESLSNANRIIDAWEMRKFEIQLELDDLKAMWQ
jgi:hypothetical protein